MGVGSIESCGLHIHGPSSSSKTTNASVGGSVCGGHPQRGFLRQWNTTSNAIEKTAALHNDNLLVLDEIGQANSDAVSTIAYLLSNSQGKARMKQDASLREIATWCLAYLSTGEMSFSDKIEQNGKNKSMAGQEVRIINIPVDAKNGENAFAEVHDLSSPQEVSTHLQKMTKKFWGTPLRAFVDALFGKEGSLLQENLNLISNDLKKFIAENVPHGANGQVYRVAKRFGLIAAAGNFACKNGIFPWTEEENWNAARKWFQVWLDERGGVESLEVAKAIEKLDDYIGLHQLTRFILLDSMDDVKKIKDFSGYKSADEKIVYFQSAFLKSLIGKAYFEEVLKTLASDARLELDSNGSWNIFKQIYNSETGSKRSMRLIGIKVKNPPIKNEDVNDRNSHYPPTTTKDNVF